MKNKRFFVDHNEILKKTHNSRKILNKLRFLSSYIKQAVYSIRFFGSYSKMTQQFWFKILTKK